MTGHAEPGAPSLAQPLDGSAGQPMSTRPERSRSTGSHTLADRQAEGAGKSATHDEEKGQKQDDSEEASPAKSKGDKSDKEDDPFLVTLEGREHLNPHTWPVWYRWWLTAFAGLLVLNATFASSAPSNLIPSIITYYGVSQEVGVLTIAIFVAGCELFLHLTFSSAELTWTGRLRPLLWGPLSERYGRRLIFLSAWIPYCAFVLGCALSPNIGSLLVFRFLSGCFASSPLTNSGGVISDIWDADRRGDALAIFSLMPFAGPAIAPIISGFMEVTHTNWRWIFWTLLAFAGACGIAIVFVLPETYVPYILHTEAKRLRKETGDDRWHSAMDKKQDSSFKAVIHRTVLKPFIMLFQEPMLLVVTLYMSFIYGIVYLLFEAIPIVFGQEHGLNAGKTGLVFLALLMGGVFAVVLYILYFNKKYMAKHHAMKPKNVPPEERLIPLFYSAPLLAVAFFWFGFTSYPSISVWSPILAIGLLGICILYTFLGGFNYIIDCYLWNAASALSANTVMRSAFGAGFPLFANQMYAKLSTPGASGLLGGLAIVFIPVPYVLYKYGRKIRSLSKNAVVLDK
ncbi:MFS transporter [Sporobolomyces koalae]|uniref:MFS transporter n=1 Tax=Sporobolomyces koalae TaxID=500713 RepID=UPI00316C59DB